MLGKDFVSGFICLAFFLTRHPCRIVTTSVDSAQLEGVLWGEIKRFIQTSKVPLEASKGGPLDISHLRIRKSINGTIDGLSYLIGRVAALGEGMSGHHIAHTGDGIPRTLFVSDEASGVDDLTMEKASEWAHRMLIIGNPYECANRFKYAVKGRPGSEDQGGDIPRENAPGYLRKVIKIQGVDSPNVRYALAQQRLGIQPEGEILIPGVLPWHEYHKRRQTWDQIKQAVGLDAEFWEGAEILLFPPQWLNHSERLAYSRRGQSRKAVTIGVDPAEGGDSTSMVAVDHLGVIELVSKKTPDTSVIAPEIRAFALRHGVKPDHIAIDRGGGGKQIADQLRKEGFPIKTIAFGEPASPLPSKYTPGFKAKVEAMEERYEYVNRRAQMYGELSELLNPANPEPFSIPAECIELRRQLAPIPKIYDREGRLVLPPKNKRPGSKEMCLIDLIGHSPDEADALVLAVHLLLHPQIKKTVAVT